MEFFNCPCPGTGDVIIDRADNLGPNKDQAGNLLTKQCNAGLHTIGLKCHAAGKTCLSQTVEIHDTDPILPQEVTFQCK